MAKVTLTSDFQYDMPGDCRLFSAGERDLVEPYLSAARARGLVATEAPIAAAADAADIPADWRSLHWFKLRALAQRVSGGPVKDKAAAIAALEAAGG